MPISPDRKLRPPLVAFRIIQGWRWILGDTLADLGALNLSADDDREHWLAKSRKYSLPEYVKQFPSVDFTDRTWGTFDTALKDLRGEARHIARYERARGVKR